MKHLILAPLLSLLAFGLDAVPAQAQKVNCSVQTCVTACNQRGGQIRLCPRYCEKLIRDRKIAGQCR